MSVPEEKYVELVRKVRTTHETFRKMERDIMNEPESDAKWEKLELMRRVLNRTSEIVNWWNNYEAKIVRREKRRQEEERRQQKAEQRAKALKAIEKAEKPYEQEWNKSCRYYNQDYLGNRSCSCGMDMTFCTKKCAFATNVKGSLKAYD